MKENGAKGTGIHSLVSSIKNKLDPKLIKSLRWIATIRNKVVHEEFEVENFKKTAKKAIRQLEEHGGSKMITLSSSVYTNTSFSSSTLSSKEEKINTSKFYLFKNKVYFFSLYI